MDHAVCRHTRKPIPQGRVPQNLDGGSPADVLDYSLLYRFFLLRDVIAVGLPREIIFRGRITIW